MRRLVLASASPARLGLLRAAGVEPVVVVSGVDEDDVSGTATEVALRLASLKASAVAGRPEAVGAVVLGCDSVLDLDGVPLGKPADAAQAVERWRTMRGRTGTLVTGHCVVDPASGEQLAAVDSAVVRFGFPDDDELAAYVASGEPLQVAGGFTVDGRGGWFVDAVEGAPSTVVGLSLPLVRRLLAELGVRVTDLWGPVPP